ncbi:hypothetical protein acdb102_45360 [Acidothermaceae bacterium B102]|nr:hypothetical protein acdb102_45360 [Acidothermaceae bacterium B102]
MRTRVAVVALALTVTGCGTAAAQSLPTRLVGHVETLHPGSLTAQDISSSQTAFGLALMAKVCGVGGPNTLISPASAADALGLLDAAATGPTAAAMATLLHLPLWGPAVVAAVHDHHAALAQLGTGKGDTLRVSNRVWPAVGIHPTTGYLDDVRTAYDAQLQALNYAKNPTKATDVINAQVGKDTGGLIPQLFDAPLSNLTRAALTNAVVLKAKWRSPFVDQQAKSPFITSSGSTSSVRQMDSSEPAPYTSTRGWQATRLPYTSGTLEAVAMLPPVGSKACALPTAAELTTLTAASSTAASVTLPQVHLTQTHDLLGVLQSMGLPVHGTYRA